MRTPLPSCLRSLAALVVLLLLPAAAVWAQPATPLLYVCNQGDATVSVIDAEQHTVVETVDLRALGFSETAKPHHAVAEPDGSFWYLSLIGENTVLKLDRNNQIVGRVAFETPGMLTLHPSRDLLLVGRSMSAVNPPKSIAVVRRSDMTLEETDTFFPRPHALTAEMSSPYAYTASLAANQILAVDLETRETELKRMGGTTQTLVQFAATPTGETLIAGGQMTGQLLVFDTRNAPAITVVDTLAVGTQPWHPVISADSRTAYVPNKASNSVSVIDLPSRTVTATITGNGLAQPHGSALSADGRYLFVSNNNRKGTYTPTGDIPDAGTVVVIDTHHNDIVSVIEVGTYPTGIGTWGGQRAPRSL
jgi:YVTN family beta-propeller protein